MREYESTFVLDPGVEDSQVDTEVEKIKEFITGKEGEIIEIQKWGRRKLAFEVKKKREGVYTLLRFKGAPSLPAELDRRYRLNESILRYLTVAYEKPPVVEYPEEGAEPGSHERPAASAEAVPAAAPPAPEAPAAPSAPETPVASEAPAAQEEPSAEEN